MKDAFSIGDSIEVKVGRVCKKKKKKKKKPKVK